MSLQKGGTQKGKVCYSSSLGWGRSGGARVGRGRGGEREDLAEVVHEESVKRKKGRSITERREYDGKVNPALARGKKHKV